MGCVDGGCGMWICDVGCDVIWDVVCDSIWDVNVNVDMCLWDLDTGM